MSFNLTTEKWISVVTQDWQKKELSLIELFEQWDKFKEIQAENPPTNLALYRFLLAILHRAYQGPMDVDHWEEIKIDNGKKAIAYLQEKADCFDLFHPEKPFMQDIALLQVNPVPIYAIHTMSQCKVFSHEHEWSGYSLSFSEASRLLVRLQGVDITSLRAFYVGQSTGNRSAVNTPSINTVNLIIQGNSLKQTLLLNLICYNPSSDFPSPVNGEDLPSWETGYNGKPIKDIPTGYIHYLTFPWRRLKLFHQDNKINLIAITMGHSLPDTIAPQQWECGIAYREDKPIRLSLEKKLWRNADCFLLSAEKTFRPRIIDWFANLRSEDLIDDWVHLQIIGFSADKAKPLGWSTENFSVPKVYITEKELATTLKIAIAIAEDHQQIFRSFKGSPYHALAETLNNHEAGKLAASLDGESRYWATLDRKFTEFLDALPKDSKEDADGITRYGAIELPQWTVTVQKAAEDAFIESIQSIRNYEARAKALQSLNYQLRKLRGDIPEKSGKAKKSKKAK
jgi:CRISPR system Cascade subunit CasA